MLYLHEKTNRFYIRATFRHEFIFWQRKSSRKLHAHAVLLTNIKLSIVDASQREYFAMMVVKIIDPNKPVVHVTKNVSFEPRAW